MTNELPLSHTSRQWLGLVAAKAKIQPRHRGQRWLLHLTPDSPHARTVTLHLRWSGVQWQLLSLTNWLITSCRSANNIMPITIFLPAGTASFFYSA